MKHIQTIQHTFILGCFLALGSVSYAHTPIALELPSPKVEEAVPQKSVPTSLSEDELKLKFANELQRMFTLRNQCLVAGDLEDLKQFYDLDTKLSLYAYESESIKLKYLSSWAQKQGVKFNQINSTLKMRKVRDRGNGLYGMTCNVCTEFSYSYIDTPDVTNTFKLGTSHYIHLLESPTKYIIMKEWYTDPFADSLDLANIKSEEVQKYISTHTPPAYTPDARTQKAIQYAHQYCGIGEGENLFQYNPKYMNCNPLGGDCANFASQILHEGGGFKKNGTWNYTSEGTKVWVNAQSFKNYMVHSGRGSYIAKGPYKSVYKEAYQMRPGDFVAYEKKGRIVHISTVTGLDSKGYPLVTCHNTDRLLVPYDLGWSNKNITFHLIDMHY
ncbi:MAG: amidase domain-containing protein [Cellulosilyticaceae bacterium]